MRKSLLLAAVATSILATSPAAALDRSAYFKMDLGAAKVLTTDFDFDNGAVSVSNGVRTRNHLGWDGDIAAGYDFGLFRLEAEGAYKRAKFRSTTIDAPVGTALLMPAGRYENTGHVSASSLMLNGLLDFAGNHTFGASVGAGIGMARVRYANDYDPANRLSTRDRDSALAFQLLGEIRFPVSALIDAGLKYRYFRTANLSYDLCDGCTTVSDYSLDGKFQSHSLMLGLTYNFGPPAVAYVPPPAPPPAPPPPPPATQTCPDGSVILATDPCPAPPPPPPPPPPTPERGF